MSPLTLSVVLSLVSAVCYAAAAIVQERVATEPGRRALLRNRRWWFAVSLNGTGGALHVVALGFGPLTVVQPLGVLTIVFALPMAAAFAARRAGATAWLGALTVSAGLAGILLLTGSGSARSLNGGDQLSLAVYTLVAVASLISAAWRMRRPAVRAVSLAAAAGISFGVGSVFIKTVTQDWSLGGIVADIPALGMIALLAVVGLLSSQASYRGAGLAAPLATVTVVNPVVAAMVGIALLGEGFRHGPLSVPLALVSAIVATWGLIVLTADSAARRQAGSPGGPVPGGGGPYSGLAPGLGPSAPPELRLPSPRPAAERTPSALV